LFLQERSSQLIQSLIEHIQISVIALLMAVLIAVPVGIYLTRTKKSAEWIIGASAVMQTIPSLALLGVLIPLVGIGKIPAIIALVLYALLPILRNTYTGIKEVAPSLKEAALAMGMTPMKQLMKVELPLALPVMMAGIRTSMVLIVGTTTLAALIGAGGLGSLILLGIDRNDHRLVLLGAIPAALLAILFDGLLRGIENATQEKSLKKAGVYLFVLLVMFAAPFAAARETKPDLVIAGKLGSEPEILINMYKLLIEEETDLNVQLKPGLGKTMFVFNALKSGEIDIYPEFTGTAITTFLKETANSTDRREVYEQARKGMMKEFNMVYLKPMSFNNTYALAVPQSFASQNGIETISDLQKVRNQLKPGFTLEFTDREDGYKGLQKVYSLTFPNVKTMEPKLRYQAIERGDVNLIDAYSTDSELRQYDLRVLKDDKNMFPPYQGAPLLRKETLEEHPELKEVLEKISGKITDDEMREMNYKVNVEGVSAKQVAKEFLQEKGLIQ
jgi:osmoprotectant transport system permease protein